MGWSVQVLQDAGPLSRLLLFFLQKTWLFFFNDTCLWKSCIWLNKVVSRPSFTIGLCIATSSGFRDQTHPMCFACNLFLHQSVNCVLSWLLYDTFQALSVHIVTGPPTEYFVYTTLRNSLGAYGLVSKGVERFIGPMWIRIDMILLTSFLRGVL